MTARKERKSRTLPSSERYFYLEEKTITGFTLAGTIFWGVVLLVGAFINRPSLQIFALFWLLCHYAETHVIVEKSVKP